ncbi:iron-siderophore ABC transporter substrate-binding protein [Streptomyces spiramenti]|uniref:Iron-siderophore ABC transporter substrate-binding protein n=1 Tax=Streptomyces spiramenti TaxID=2720606 RepID=A0ABX1AK45_9ACTN|nr:iron-siderophore ABC transporter substrate-binding protein [Streptomyces spiramenti]
MRHAAIAVPGTRTADRRSRRPLSRLTRLTAALAAPMLFMSLTACGSDADSDDTAGDNGGDTGSSETTDGAFPATVQTKFGEITIEEKPQRILALGWGDAETVLALGEQPIGASDWLAFGGDGVGPWAEGLYEESPEIIGTLEPEFEKIAALDPDLIIDVKSSGAQERYDTLSKIATTVGVPEGGDNYLTSHRTQTEMISAALGMPEKGAELLAEVDAAFEAAVEEYPEFEGKSVTVGSRTSNGYGAYVRGTGRVDFVERLGLVNNEQVQEQATDDFSIEVSRENLNMLDADLVIIAPIGIEADEIADDSLFQAIPAVEDGRSLIIDSTDGISTAFATETILSVPFALEKVAPLFAEALNGGSE